MLNFAEKKTAETKLTALIESKIKYTKKLMDCDAQDIEVIVELLNEFYEGIRLTRRTLGFLKGIKKRKISTVQANKFRELYRDTLTAA